MSRYLLERLLYVLPTLLGASVVIFLLVHLTGDPALLMLAPETPPAQVEAFREKYGFDKPLPVQYVAFVSHALRGNLGESFRFRKPALPIVLGRLPATLELAFLSVFFATAIGIPLGVLSAATKGSWVDTVIRTLFFVGQGIPPFWLGLVLIVVFSVQLGILPLSRPVVS